MNVIDYTIDGKKLCVAGLDRNIYIYDDVDSRLYATLHSKGLRVNGHVNRIFSIKCHPEDSNVLVSAGWDGSIKIYDIRAKNPVASIAGPYVSGDSIDMFDDMIVTGSSRNKNCM